MKPNPLDYKPLFRVEGIYTCLGTEQFLNGSLGLGWPLCISVNGVWHSFIHKEKERLCLEKGLKIFSNRDEAEEYFADFEDYIELVKRTIIPKYSHVPERVTKTELLELLPLFGKFLYFYGITEFSYHDLAYEVAQQTKNPLLEENLKRLGKIKFEGREILNAYIHLGGVIQNVLRRISLDHYGDDEAAFYLCTEELLELFDSKKTAKEVIENRKRCHATSNVGGQIVHFSFEESMKLAEAFIVESNKTSVAGRVAYRGRAVGMVVVAPMLSDPEKIMQVIKKMNQGDILVAHSTTPEFVPLCNKAAAIVADQGGMLSHAAIISRELGIPCIIGTGDATQVFKDGDIVEVDAHNGIVRKIK